MVTIPLLRIDSSTAGAVVSSLVLKTSTCIEIFVTASLGSIRRADGLFFPSRVQCFCKQANLYSLHNGGGHILGTYVLADTGFGMCAVVGRSKQI